MSVFERGVKKFVIVGASLVAVIVLVWVVTYWRVTQLSTVTIGIGGHQIEAKLAKSQTSRARGLSGVRSLSLDRALILDYGHDTDARIWMKDMLMSIDALWVDSGGEIVHLENDLQPEEPPRTVYQSSLPARYVIELNHQAIEDFSIQTGQKINLNNN